MDTQFEQAKAFFLNGLDHYQAGRYAQAEQQFTASLALVPGRLSVLVNLGAARLKLGRIEEALAVLDEALAQAPDSFDALGHKGAALAELGRHTEALHCFERSLELQPQQGLVWSLRGSVLREMGRLPEAASAFEQALAQGADPQLNAFYLAACRQEAAPPAMPEQYVQSLFDRYAAEFDAHVVQHLHYDAPRVLAEGLAGRGRRFGRALDLGCGTGLCGPLLKPLCDALDGVDLSAGMLEKARALGVYERLEQAELVQFLQAAPPGYGLVIAADVLIYVGALEPVFAGVARVLQAGGTFCFTVEQAAGARDVELRPSLRYAHSEGYLRRLAQDHGFTVERLQQGRLREEQRVPIPGLFAWLRKN